MSRTPRTRWAAPLAAILILTGVAGCDPAKKAADSKAEPESSEPASVEPTPEPTAEPAQKAKEATAVLVVEFRDAPKSEAFSADIKAMHEAAAKAGFEPPIVVETDGKGSKDAPGASRYELHGAPTVADIFKLTGSKAFDTPTFENVSVADDVLVARGGAGTPSGVARMAMFKTDPAELRKRLSAFDSQADVAYIVVHLSGGNAMEQSVWMFGAGAEDAMAKLLADKTLEYPDGDPFLEVSGTVP